MPFVEVPIDLCCPIDADLFHDPVFTESGDSYSREPIELWFATCEEKKNPLTSPATNERLTSRKLVPNRELQSRVSKFRESLLSGQALKGVIESGDVKKLEASNVLKSDLNGPFEIHLCGNRPLCVSALTVAVVSKKIDMFRFLLPHVDETNARGFGDGCALHFAAAVAPDFVPLLLEAKADVNALSSNGATPLHAAVQKCPSVVPLLIAKGANVNARSKPNDRTPLFSAYTIETVKQLVAAGADLFAVDSANLSALFCVREPTYFLDLFHLMMITNKSKASAALHATKCTVGVSIGASHNPHLVGAAVPACIEHYKQLANDAKSSDFIEQKARLLTDVWHGIVISGWLNPATGDRFPFPDFPQPDPIECIKSLIECGGGPFINSPAEDCPSSPPLLRLLSNMDNFVPDSKELKVRVRIMLTLIAAGADPKNQKVAAAMTGTKNLLSLVLELSVPFFAIGPNASSAAATPLALAGGSAVASALPSALAAGSASALAAGSESSSGSVHMKRNSENIDSKRRSKRVRTASSSTAAAGSLLSSGSAEDDDEQ